MMSVLVAASCLAGSVVADEQPLRIAIAASPNQFASLEMYLEQHYLVQCVRVDASKGGPIPDAAKLRDCDVMLLNHYRTEPTAEQLAEVRKFFLSGKPVVGARKASHAYQNWLEIDRIVFGVKYGSHFNPSKKKEDLKQVLTPRGRTHGLVRDLSLVIPGGGLYKYTELADDVEVLIEGGVDGDMMPQTWQRTVAERGGQRVFYTRYDPDDVNQYPEVRDLLVDALFWAAKRDGHQLRRTPPGD
ncbi:ThuA domain-containing protein [Lignipirellula cremea]|nr:ThuA domain-containing protein [Lignipirellula cremea]